MNRFVLLALLSMALLLLGVSCGGGAGTVDLGGDKDVQGISEGGFNLVRYDGQGSATNALNPTLGLTVHPDGATTTVTIAIADKQPEQGVTCDLNYDPSKYTPVDVQFSGLIDTQVELAETSHSGLVAVGQVSTDGVAQRSGQFAVVTFRNEPNRIVSAITQKSIDSQYSAGGFTADGFTATGDGSGGFSVDILGIFSSLSGDGDQNGASNIADLTPLGAMLNKPVTATDAVSARADYDGNGLPNISDLTPLGANLGEVTTAIEIYAGDTDPPTTLVDTLPWASSSTPVAPSTTTSDPQQIWRHWSGTYDAAALTGFDTNSDGHLFVAARASNGTDNGPLFTPAVDVNIGTTTNSNFIVTSLHLQLAGQDVTDGATLAIQDANQHVQLEVSSFDGTFNGVAFNHQTDLDTPTHPTTAEYQDELAKIQEDLQIVSQTLSTAPGFETDKPGVLLNFTHHGTGSAPAQAATAEVFPDDDPGNAAEGTVTFGFNRTNNNVGDMTVTLDVQADPSAPLVDTVNTGAGQDGNGNWIVNNTTPDIKGHLTFPGGDPATFDDTTVGAELVDLTHDVVLPIDFKYSATPPTQGGTFQFTPAAGGYNFTLRVPAGAFNSSSKYAVRFFAPTGPAPDEQHGSSVNKPGDPNGFFTGGTVPSGFASQVLPRHDVNFNEEDIAIIPSDPQILRNPQQIANAIDGTVTPLYDGAADVLKASGDFFNIEFSNNRTYPEVVVKAGSDPGVINPTDEALTNGEAGVIQTETNPHRIVINIASIPDDTLKTFAYKVFGAPVIPGDLSSRPVITSGTFTHNPDPGVNINNINGVDFGVNIFGNNGDLNLNQADFSNKLIHVTKLPTDWGDNQNGGDNDVLFVQFNGGHIIPDSFQNGTGNLREGFTNNSVSVVLINGLGPQVTKPLDVRIAGIGTNNLDYIGLAHYVFNEDANASRLVETLDYEVQLKDGFGGPVFTFGNQPTDPHITVVN